MRIGYACVNTSLGDMGKTFAVRAGDYNKMSPDEVTNKIRIAIHKNITNLVHMIMWNAEHGLGMLRISSSFIPLWTYEGNRWNWMSDSDILIRLYDAGRIARELGVRLTFHPDHFVVLNSQTDRVMQNSIEEIYQHYYLSSVLGADTIVLHIGGVYGDLYGSIRTFINTVNGFPEEVKRLLCIENGHHNWNLMHTIHAHEMTGCAVIPDLHHNVCNPSVGHCDWLSIRETIVRSWGGRTPKLHISSGNLSHIDMTHATMFTEYDMFRALKYSSGVFDIMCESKGKELSALQLKRYSEDIYPYQIEDPVVYL